jgi:hypothetical protein
MVHTSNFMNLIKIQFLYLILQKKTNKQYKLLEIHFLIMSKRRHIYLLNFIFNQLLINGINVYLYYLRIIRKRKFYDYFKINK